MFSRNRPDRDDRALFGQVSRYASWYEGRSNRRQFWLSMAGTVGVLWLLTYLRHLPPVGLFTGVLVVLVNTSIRRLHDIGLTGWWAAVLPSGMVLSLFAVARWPGHPYILTGAWVLGAALFAAVVGLWPGDPEGNRFGQMSFDFLKRSAAPR